MQSQGTHTSCILIKVPHWRPTYKPVWRTNVVLASWRSAGCAFSNTLGPQSRLNVTSSHGCVGAWQSACPSQCHQTRSPDLLQRPTWEQELVFSAPAPGMSLWHRCMLHCVLGGMIPNSLSCAFRKTKPSNEQDMPAVLVKFLMCVLSFPLSLKAKGKRNGRSNIT